MAVIITDSKIKRSFLFSRVTMTLETKVVQNIEQECVLGNVERRVIFEAQTKRRLWYLRGSLS